MTITEANENFHKKSKFSLDEIFRKFAVFWFLKN
jgi:hypothetical protein